MGDFFRKRGCRITLDDERGCVGLLKQIDETLRTMLDEAEGTFSAAIYHFQSGESFAYNPEETFFAASIIKVPLMAAVFEQQWQGNLTLADKVVVRYEDQVGGSGILQNLMPGTELSLYDVMLLMIIESDNTATNLVVDRVGKENIQRAMKEWGFEKSRFYNKLSVIPAKIEAVNTVHAGEMTEFLKKMANGKIVSWKACAEMVKVMKQQKFQDGLPSLLPVNPDDVIGEMPLWECANKTGWVTGVTHDMGLLYFPGHTFAVSVFGKEIKQRADANRLYGGIGRLLYDTAMKR